jgi:hypothetical protein
MPSLAQAQATTGTHPIDIVVNKKLRALNVEPSALCTDAEFLRRVCIDLMGALPPREKARQFLADPSPGKRARLVEWIFTRPEYADYWAMKWGDVLRIKSEFPSNLWPNAVQAYHAWLRSAIAANMPCDQLTRALLLTSGSNFRDPPVNFYRAMQKRTPEHIASLAAIAFMGVRLEFSAEPKHPYATWTRAQSLGLAAFFTTVKYKPTGEWKEEIVYFSPDWPPYKAPDTGEVIPPAFPGKADPALLPELRIRKGNPLKIFANWLTAPANPWYARHLANRHWAALFGSGITSPVDDVRPSNPPSDPELLDLLAARLTRHKYDLRDLLRFIVTSQTYQRSSLRNPSNRSDDRNWSHYYPRRLDAEVLADAIGGLTGGYESFSSRIPEPLAFWPADFRAVQNPDASVTTGFLQTFGRPARDSSLESERNRSPSISQALYLLNSSGLNGKIQKRDGGVAALFQKHAQDLPAFADECYLALLSRHPAAAEKSAVAQHFARNGDKLQAAQDLVWALINTKEFLYNH